MTPEAAVHLRRMTGEDLGPVMAIAGELKDAPHWPREAYETALRPDALPKRIAFVAERPDQGGVVGFVVASVVAPEAELESIAVAAAEQGKGIGWGLAEALAAELIKAGVCEVLLEVRASNRRALAFYRRLGWSETGRRPRYYADPEEAAVLMSKRLG